MASLENRTGYYNVVFRFGGRKYTRSLGTNSEQEAERLRANLEQTIRDIKSGRLVLPSDADVATFLLSDGKLTQPLDAPSATDGTREVQLSLRELFTTFFDQLPEGSLEPSTVSQMQTHRNNLLRVLGDGVLVDKIKLETLDDYTRLRSLEPGHKGQMVAASTIKKELGTLRRVWRWAKKREKVTSELPEIRDIELPKSRELPPFQTYDEIQVQIEQGGLNGFEQQELWESLYLRCGEIDELLQHVRLRARHAFLYPMFVAAAHTGARRSELLRSRPTDIRGDVLIIREKKRRRGRESTRRVPMSSLLKETLTEWFQEHPGGPHTFGLIQDVDGNPLPTIRSLTRNQANSFFQQTIQNSRWSRIRGWHCLRHSFISNLASNGIDQRLIDEFVGHTTEEMRRRYRHLFPEVKQAAIRSVFG